MYFSIIHTVIYSQHPYFYTINDEDGLPSNEVYQVLQDDFGYIWIGCDAGLYRYDGFQFKHYYNSQQNGRAISFLKLDSQQRIWCKNFYGQLYRVEGDSLNLIKTFNTSHPSFPSFEIDETGNIWTAQLTKLVSYNISGDSLNSISIKNLSSNIIAIKIFKGSIIIINKDLTAKSYHIKSGKLIDLKSSKSDLVSSNSCLSLVEHNSVIYGLFETDQTNNKSLIYKIDGNEINQIYEVKFKSILDRAYYLYSDNKNLWVTTSSGVKTIIGDTLSNFEGEKISSMYLDKEGQYWFSTLQNGIYVSPNYKVIKYNSTNSGLIEHNLTTLRATHQNELLTGTYLGRVFKYDLKKNLFEDMFIDEEKNFHTVKNIFSNEKYTIISRGRFCIIDNNTNKYYYPKTSHLKDFAVVGDSIYLVHSNFVAKTSINEMIKNPIFNQTIISNEGAKSIEWNEDEKRIYLLKSNGLFKIESDGTWVEILDGNTKINANTIAYNEGILWISTLSNGVYGLKNEQIKFRFSNTNLLNENIVRFSKYLGNFLWVCTDNYLHRIEINKNEVSVFGQTDGIDAKNAQDIALVDKTIFLATNKGLISFPENMRWKNIVKPKLIIEKILLNDQSLSLNSPLSLSYANSRLKFYCKSVSIKSSSFFNYKYRILGQDKDTNWSIINAITPYIELSGLPSGNFIFQVKSINEHGIESEIKSIEIQVDYPYWQRWWFYGIIFIFTALIVTLVFLARIHYIRKRALLENKVIASQLIALKAQMNPHFMYNALNSIQALIIKKDVKNSNIYLGKFSSLMRKILDASGKDQITLLNEIEILELYLELEQLRFGDEFEYYIEIEENVNPYEIDIQSMIIQPFIENALKHGLLHKKGAKKLTIHFNLESTLICTIIDNGIGRAKSNEIKKRQTSQHQPFSSEATFKRIELLNEFSNNLYQISILDLMDNDMPIGTKVIISIPIK